MRSASEDGQLDTEDDIVAIDKDNAIQEPAPRHREQTPPAHKLDPE